MHQQKEVKIFTKNKDSSKSMESWLKTVNKNSIITSIKQLPLNYSSKVRLHDIEYKPIRQEQQKRQFYRNYRDSFVQANNNNALYFNPFQRNGPYRGNIRKNLRQMKLLFDTSQGNLCLSYNKWTPEQIIALMQDSSNKIVKQVKLNALYLSWTRVDNILSYLSIKAYSRLKILNLGGNHLQSVQLLSQVCMPSLQHIHLWSNHITNISSMSRNNWPSIQVIDVHANRIVEISRLRYLGHRHLMEINLDANYIVNFDQCIIACSRSANSKISLMRTNAINFIGRSKQRRRKRAIQVEPCNMKVKYV